MDINIKNQLNSRTSQVLVYLKDNEGCNIKNISNSTKIDYNFVTKIIYRSEEEGLVTVESDTRGKKISLTAKGKDIAKDLKKIAEKLE